MILHKCKDLTKVCSMNFYVQFSAHSPAMDEYILNVTRCEILHRSQQICDSYVECGYCITKPLWHN